MPEPVGPVTSSAPVGRRDDLARAAAASRSERPSSSSVGAPARLVEQAHHDRLALDGRQRRNADVEHPPGRDGVQRDAAVLRPAALGDVELREHLQTGRDAVREPLRDALDLLEHAVDAEADEQAVLLRLDVNVARAILGGLEDDRVDEPHERRVGDAVVDVEVVLDLDDLQLTEVDPRAGSERFARASKALDLRVQVITRSDGELDREPRRKSQLVDACDVRRIGDRDPKSVPFEPVRKRFGPLEHGKRDLLDGFRRDLLGQDLDEREMVARSERARDADARREPFVDQRLRQRASARATAGRSEPVAGDETERLDQVGNKLGELVDRVRRREAGRPLHQDGCRIVGRGSSMCLEKR